MTAAEVDEKMANLGQRQRQAIESGDLDVAAQLDREMDAALMKIQKDTDRSLGVKVTSSLKTRISSIQIEDRIFNWRKDCPLPARGLVTVEQKERVFHILWSLRGSNATLDDIVLTSQKGKEVYLKWGDNSYFRAIVNYLLAVSAS